MDARHPYHLNDPSRLLSPSLLIDRTLVRRNLEAMIALARGPDRLRPHVKTHKMPAIVRMCEAMGIRKHKCATIAEAEMVAEAGGTDVLLAYPMVGPNIARLARLVRTFPGTTFRALVDDPLSAEALAEGMRELDRPLPVLIDLEVGMGRTGIAPDDTAVALARQIEAAPSLVLDGLFAYDGHIKDGPLDARQRSSTPGIERTMALRDRLEALGLPVPRLVLGGTPTFPVHAALDIPGVVVECSPGTCTLHDIGYASRYPDLPFTPAAFLLGRVISRPRAGRLCLDLGHKAVAADPLGPRLTLLDIPRRPWASTAKNTSWSRPRTRNGSPLALRCWHSPRTSARPARCIDAPRSSKMATSWTNGRSSPVTENSTFERVRESGT